MIQPCQDLSEDIPDLFDPMPDISIKLQDYPSPQSGNPDKAWYYIAPLLLDGKKHVQLWLSGSDKITAYDSEEEKTKKQKGFTAHLDALKTLYYQFLENAESTLGKRPDDLLDVLADMAIASPAVCVYRTYKKYINDPESIPLHYPSQVARVFINRMNTAEATAVIEIACGRKSDDAHWQNLLSYCRQGNLQAVFDEYAHLISSGLDHDSTLVDQMHRQIISAMNIHTTQYGVDTYRDFQRRVEGQKDRLPNIRTHFAVAFTKGEGKETDTDRKKTIRDAFNSPFWPFVLASTSIGQEGLDFHNYCRRIVHWNLPSNPIDLEQREGRINRFECLAIRQNIAKRYGTIHFGKDIWNEMFEEASVREKASDSSDTTSTEFR